MDSSINNIINIISNLISKIKSITKDLESNNNIFNKLLMNIDDIHKNLINIKEQLIIYETKYNDVTIENNILKSKSIELIKENNEKQDEINNYIKDLDEIENMANKLPQIIKEKNIQINNLDEEIENLNEDIEKLNKDISESEKRIITLLNVIKKKNNIIIELNNEKDKINDKYTDSIKELENNNILLKNEKNKIYNKYIDSIEILQLNLKKYDNKIKLYKKKIKSLKNEIKTSDQNNIDLQKNIDNLEKILKIQNTNIDFFYNKFKNKKSCIIS